MGKLDIELRVRGQKLTAHINAESPETYQALIGEVESLKEALAAGGLELAEMTISYDHQDSGHREFADLGLRQPASNGRFARDDEMDESESPLHSNNLEHQGQVDRLV